MSPILPTLAAATTPATNWCDIEYMKPAFHEAGHAVIARLLDFNVVWVSIDGEFIRKDPTAIAHDIASCGAVCMTISLPRLQPIFKSRRALTKQDKATVIGYCSHVLAGPHVEMISHPESFDPSYCMNDYEQFQSILESVEPNQAARKKLFDATRRQVSRTVKENLRVIDDVGQVLVNRGTLMGHEIDALIQSGLARAT